MKYIFKVTSLGRVIDPRYPTNAWIILLSLAAGAVFGIIGWIQSGQFDVGFNAGFDAGITTFFGWALAREIDPDHAKYAFIGAVVALAGLIWLGTPNFSLILPIFLIIRLSARSTGVSAKPFDSVMMVAISGWAVWNGDWLISLLVGIVLIADSMLEPRVRRHAWIGLLAVGFSIAGVIRSGLSVEGIGSWLVLPGLIAVGYLTAKGQWGPIQSVCDAGGKPLFERRMQFAGYLAAAAPILIAFVDGWNGTAAISPLLAAMVGAIFASSDS